MNLHTCASTVKGSSNSIQSPRELTPSLKSKKFLSRSLLLTTAWLLCDIFGSNLALAEADAKSTSSDAKKEDSKDKDTKKVPDKEDLKDGAKEEAKEPSKPVFSKNELNVLDTPDSAIDDFDQITKKIFAKKDHGYTDTLDEAMTSTYETNPEIKVQRAALRATDEGVVQAKAGWRPTVTGTLAGSLIHNKGNPDDRRRETDPQNTDSKHAQQHAEITVTQNLFQGGNTVYSTRSAVSAIKANRAALKDTEQKILLESVTAYLNLLAQYAALEYLLQNEEGQKKALEQNMAKYEAGDDTRTIVAQAEYAYTDAVAQRVRAEGELETLKANYEKVTNRKPGNLTVPEIPEVPDSLDKVLEQVRLNNPQIIQNQYEEQRARHQVDVAQTGLLPKIDLTGTSKATLDRNKDTKTLNQGPGERGKYFTDKQINNSVQLAMTIPLYEAGSFRSKTRQAAEQASQQRIKIESIRREVIDKASKAWNDLISAKQNRDVLKNQMKAAATSVEGVRQEAAVGSRTYLDVVTETTKLINSQRFYVDAERTYRLAAFQVLYWMGALSPKNRKLCVEIYDPKAHYKEVKNKF